MSANRQIVLASRPKGWVSEANFRLVESPMPAPGEGQVLVRNHWLSLDPYMRGRMDDAKSYAKSVEIGEVMMKAGKLKYRETIAAGLEAAPKAFVGLLKGENLGKQLVKLT